MLSKLAPVDPQVSDDAPVRRLSFGMGADPAGAPGSAPGTPSRRLLPREDEEQRQPQQAQAQQLQHHNHDLQQRQQQQQQAAGAAPQHADAAPRDSPKMSRVLQQSQDPNALELASPTPPMRFGGLPAAKRPRTTATPVRLFR